MSNQFFDGLYFEPLREPRSISAGTTTAASRPRPIFGGGVGYQFTDHLRGDLTVEWRGKSDFNALELAHRRQTAIR